MKKVLIILSLLLGFKLSGQDILSAHIQTKHVSGYTYSITLTLLTDASFPISRPSVTIHMGNGEEAALPFMNATTSNGIIVKTYSGTHTYANAGTYSIWYIDNYRIAGIKNMPN